MVLHINHFYVQLAFQRREKNCRNTFIFITVPTLLSFRFYLACPTIYFALACWKRGFLSSFLIKYFLNLDLCKKNPFRTVLCKIPLFTSLENNSHELRKVGVQVWIKWFLGTASSETAYPYTENYQSTNLSWANFVFWIPDKKKLWYNQSG